MTVQRATRADAGALPLVGREEELATLEEARAAALSGTGSAVLVEGPAGIGKTRLLTATRERATRSGMRVLHARGTELERDYPLGVVRQCLEPAVRRQPDRARLLTGAAALAEPVLLDVSHAGDVPPVGILHGLYWLVANLADEGPLLLVVDDAHWADEPSLLEGGSVEGIPLDGSTVGEAVVLGNLVFPRMGRDAIAAEIADIAQRAARQVERLLDEGALSLSFTGMVLGLRWSDRLDAAERLLDRAVDIARRRGSVTDFAVAMTLRASVRRRAGRLRDAEADARVALAAALGPEWSFARGIVPLLGSLIDQGRADEAARELAVAIPDGRIPDSPPMIPVVLARMWVHAARREHEPAIADWQEAVDRVERTGGINAAWIEDLVVVADAHHALGDQPAAEAAATQALELARRWDTPGAIGQALHAYARIRRSDDPVEVLRTAVGLLAESPARLEHARALVTLGAVLRRQGNRADSREPLREGHELARCCAAEVLVQWARSELRASGIRLRRGALTGADALTPSERRIAEMAAGGLSNADIAQELFLTVKTVEMHLTRAYRKLDIRRRSELAGALVAKP